MKIYNCPECGKKAFNPLTKALSGQMNSKGRVCPHCGKHIVNGVAATVFNFIFAIVMFALLVVCYLRDTVRTDLMIPVIIAAIVLVPRIVNAFLFPMTASIRKDVLS